MNDVHSLTRRRPASLAALGCALLSFACYVTAAGGDDGRIDFQGLVSDVSCNVALNGGNNGSGTIWLTPLSLAEIHGETADTFIKPQAFTLELSNCELNYPHNAVPEGAFPAVNVRWVNGYTLASASGDKPGYLANSSVDGARNIYLALAVNNEKTLQETNIIIPAKPKQNRVEMRPNQNGRALLTYYVGYVSPSPQQVTSGPVASWATLELEYE